MGGLNDGWMKWSIDEQMDGWMDGYIHLQLSVLFHQREFNIKDFQSSGEEHGNPLQYSCLENPTDRGAWWATVCWIVKSQTQLSD